MLLSIKSSERGWRVNSPSASPAPGPDEDPAFMPAESAHPWEPVITRPDPMSPGEWEALLAASRDEIEPPGDDDDEYLDPEGSVLPPGEDLAAIEAEAGRFAAEHAADAEFIARAEAAE